MTNIGCLTFHAAYNYGSILQAYALQQYIINKFNCKYTIINFRPKAQKELYKIISSKNSIARNLYNLVFFVKMYKKKVKFETFLKTELFLSESFSEPDKKEIAGFDLIIVGGDQPWNIGCIDFDPFYFVPYDFSGKKISFAVSMGGFNLFDNKIDDFLYNSLNDFDALSVREEDTKNKLLKYVNEIKIHYDPVFLLSKEEWKTLLSKIKKTKIKKKYIFVYMLKILRYLSSKILNASHKY